MANDTLSNILDPVISKLNNSFEREFERDITKYVDYNNNVLTAQTPLYRLVFNEGRRDNLLKMVGIGKHELNIAKNLIDKDKNVTKPIMYEMVSTPFNYLSAKLIRHYYLAKNQKMVNFLVMNLALSFYSLIHPKYYRYLPNPDIMEFTINRVTTKYTFKIYKTMLSSIQHIAYTNQNSMIDTLVKDGDTGTLFYLVSLNSRLNNIMRSFCEEYMKDFEAKNAIFSQQDSTDPENFIMTTNLSGLISSKTTQAVTDFFTTRVDKRMVELSAKNAKVNASVLEQSLGLIKERKSEEISTIMRDILITYLDDKDNTERELGSTKFVVYCLKIYAKSNVKMNSVVEIKKLLDDLLEATSTSYQRCEREATRLNYRKALFYYIVLSMQKSIR